MWVPSSLWIFVLPCAANLNGEYGLRNVYVGVPCVIGAGGVEKVIEIKLDASEKKAFQQSVDAVKGLLKVTQGIMAKDRKAAAPAKKAPRTAAKKKPAASAAKKPAVARKTAAAPAARAKTATTRKKAAPRKAK